MNATTATNIVMMLTQDPLYYRNFGYFWWWIKRELKTVGHTQDEIVHLGEYEDNSVWPLYEDYGDVVLEAMAFQENHRFDKRNNPYSQLPGGETYLLVDEDVE